jgi:hypothetical protein
LEDNVPTPTEPSASPSGSSPSGSSAHLESLCRALRDFLLGLKRALDDEIRSYPTPIPRCDAQFNFLYEQRSRLAAFIARTEAISKSGDESSAQRAVLAEFNASAPFGESASELALRARVRAALSGPNPALNPTGRHATSSRPASA